MLQPAGLYVLQERICRKVGCSGGRRTVETDGNQAQSFGFDELVIDQLDVFRLTAPRVHIVVADLSVKIYFFTQILAVSQVVIWLGLTAYSTVAVFSISSRGIQTC